MPRYSVLFPVSQKATKDLVEITGGIEDAEGDRRSRKSFHHSDDFLSLSRAESVCTRESKHEMDVVKEMQERPSASQSQAVRRHAARVRQ